MESVCLAQIPSSAKLSASTDVELRNHREITAVLRSFGGVDIVTEHLFHGGMYARTIRLAAGVIMTGALIKIPTVLIVNGYARVLEESGWRELRGYNVLAGSAGRAQVFAAVSDVEMTMLFSTKATTVEVAEREFTDEYENLMSRGSSSDRVTVTGE